MPPKQRTPQDVLDQLQVDLEALTVALGPVIEPEPAEKQEGSMKSILNEFLSRLPLLEQAEMVTLTVYTIERLLKVLVLLNEGNPENPPIVAELERVVKYMAKIRQKKGGKGPDPEGEVRRTTVNKEAAKRVVHHELSFNRRMNR